MLLVDEIEGRQIDHALGLGDAGKMLIFVGTLGIGCVDWHGHGTSETHVIGIFVAVHTAFVFVPCKNCTLEFKNGGSKLLLRLALGSVPTTY